MKGSPSNLRVSFRIAGLITLACILSAPAAEPTNRASEARADPEWRLGNERLELRFERHGSRVSARHLLNKLSGRTISIAEDDFSLGIEGRPALQAGDFVFQAAREHAFA